MSRTERAAQRCDSSVTKPGKPISVVELIATVALAFSTIVAMTAVSIGIARAADFGSDADPARMPLSMALFVVLLVSTLGGLAAMIANDLGRPR